MGGGATAFLGLVLNDLDVIMEGTGVLAVNGTLLMAPSACMWIADRISCRDCTTTHSP